MNRFNEKFQAKGRPKEARDVSEDLIQKWRDAETMGKVLECPRCMMSFTSHLGLLQHYRHCFDNVNIAENSCRYMCPRCSSEFANSKSLSHHRRYCPGDSNKKPTTKKTSKESPNYIQLEVISDEKNETVKKTIYIVPESSEAKRKHDDVTEEVTVETTKRKRVEEDVNESEDFVYEEEEEEDDNQAEHASPDNDEQSVKSEIEETVDLATKQEQGNTLVESEENCALFSDEKRIHSNKSDRKYRKFQSPSIISNEKDENRPSFRPQTNLVNVENASLSPDVGNISNVSSSEQSDEIGVNSDSNINLEEVMDTNKLVDIEKKQATTTPVVDETVKILESISQTISNSLKDKEKDIDTKSVSSFTDNEKLIYSGTENEKAANYAGQDTRRDNRELNPMSSDVAESTNELSDRPSQNETFRLGESISQTSHEQNEGESIIAINKPDKTGKIKYINAEVCQNRYTSSGKAAKNIETSEEVETLQDAQMDISVTKNKTRGRKPKVKKQTVDLHKDEETTANSFDKGILKKKTRVTKKPEDISTQKGRCKAEASRSTASKTEMNCSKCDKKFDKKSFLADHLMRRHCILQGEYNPNKCIKLLKVLECEKCGKELRSMTYFKLHTEWCGRENEREQCNKCNKQIQKMYMKMHMAEHRRRDKAHHVVENKPTIEDEETEGVSVKRRAAKRALTTLQTISDEARATKRAITASNTTLDEKFLAVRKPIEKKMDSDWKNTLKTKGTVKCKYESCNEYFCEYEKVVDHFIHGHRSKIESEKFFTYKCIKCDKSFTSKNGAKYHVERCALWAQEEQNKDDTDTSNSDSNEVESDSDVVNMNDLDSSEDSQLSGVDENKLSGIESEVSSADEKEKQASIGVRKFYEDFFCKNLAKISKNCDLSARDAKEFISRNSCSEIYKDWKLTSDDVTFCNENLARKYLPSSNSSLGFSIRKGKSNASENIFLEKFDAVEQGQSAIAYTGGPIFSGSWIPLHVKDAKVKENQFAAITTTNEYEVKVPNNTLYPCKGTIQIWNFGDLNGTSVNQKPKLEFCIGHELGILWSTKFCPSGAYDVIHSNKDKLRRLGLLCVGGSQGYSAIYSVPHPDSLHGLKLSPIQVPKLCLFKPSILLLPHSDCRERSQVTCIDWSWKKSHSILITSHVNGSICVFNLNSSSLLQLSYKSCKAVLPARVLSAHNGVVHSISFCHQKDSYIGSCGSDNLIQVWNLNKMDNRPVIRIYRREKPICIHFPLMWNAFICSFDDALNYNNPIHGSIFLYYLEDHPSESPIRLLPMNSTTWALTSSPWTNTAYVVDEDGVCAAFELVERRGKFPDKMQRILKRRYIIFRSYLEKIKKESIRDLVVPVEPLSSMSPFQYNNDEEPFYESRNDFIIDHTLRYYDANFKTGHGAEGQTQNRNVNILNCFSMKSLHFLDVNPHKKEARWILTGGQNGLMRIICSEHR
ncbi:DgyrCDS3422 [Dimorphilus gyrociliatus]|uniref:DgyrCDS3422 n=1 Tax=Dimorphilus gyrociliatus TaxID=2664684 RepID=A0A7I8VFU5_9ANNE|nr:DgyrCDS3422 [Dimorphilus gyrociliatus]